METSLNNSMPEILGWIIVCIVMIAILGAGILGLLLIVFPPKGTKDLTGKRRYAIYLIGVFSSLLPPAACIFAYYPLATLSTLSYFLFLVIGALFGIYIAKRLYKTQSRIAQAYELAGQENINNSQ